MIRGLKLSIKKLFEFLGYSVKKIYSEEVFHFPRDFFPAEINNDQKKIIREVEKYSMSGRIRMSLLIKIIEHIYNKSIEGDIVECGVWKGGNLLCAQIYLNHLKLHKKIFGYDTFEGMTEPSEHDIQELQTKSNETNKTGIKKSVASLMMKSVNREANEGKNIWAYSSINEVEDNIKKKVPDNDIKLIKGPVEQTLLQEINLPKKISLLRLDTDFYESTKVELEILYPRLVSGGFLIIDDYGHWKGSRKAVNDYFDDKKPFIHVIDETCRLIIKS